MTDLRWTCVQHAIWDDPSIKRLSNTAWRVALHMLRATLAKSNEHGMIPADPQPFDMGPSNLREEMHRNTYRRAVDELITAGVVERLTTPRNGERSFYRWTLIPEQSLTRSKEVPPTRPILVGDPSNSGRGTRTGIDPHRIPKTDKTNPKTGGVGGIPIDQELKAWREGTNG